MSAEMKRALLEKELVDSFTFQVKRLFDSVENGTISVGWGYREGKNLIHAIALLKGRLNRAERNHQKSIDG